MGPTPSASAPPWRRSLAMVMCMVYILVNSAFVFGMVSAFLSWYVFGKLFCGHVGFKGPAKSRTHEPSWGLSDVSGMLFGYCATGGGYHGGGVFGPLGTMVPWGDFSKRRQAGPWAPPPCGVNSPGKLLWSLSGFCSLLFRFFCPFFVQPLLFLRGRCLFFWFFEPFTTRPVSGFYLLVLFLFLYGLFVDAVCSLSLSLSGAGEPQTFLVWGSPCVSSSWTRSSPSIRTSSSSPSPRRSPAPVFFFRRRRFRFGVFSFLVLYLVLVFVGLLLCLCFLSWPSGAFFFFFWVGGVPFAAFSLCFPLGSRGWGRGFPCCSLASCICLARSFRLG